MHSIRTKITVLTILVILISTTLVGVAAVLTARDEAESRSGQLLSSICTSKGDEIDYFLSNIESSVETTARFAYDTLDVTTLWEGGVIGATGSGESLDGRERTKGQKKELEKYLDGYLQKTAELFSTLVSGETSVRTYYFHINGEFGNPAQGYWYGRVQDADFEKLETTDLSKYDADDFGRVGWYYLPQDRGRPIWMDPYKNENLEEELISYVAPLYKAGTFIGVIGVDCSYSALVDRIRDIKVIDSGYAFLVDSQGKIVYHPTLEDDTMLQDVSPDLSTESFSAGSPEIVSYTFEGDHKKAAWCTLTDGLRLVITVPDSEIDAGWRWLAMFVLGVAIAVLVVSVIVITSFTRRITNPLERLAQAAESLSAGNYDVDLSYDGNDEVGTLTRSFTQMAGNLNTFIQDLNSRAYRDALTSVRNKGAYDIYVHDLDEAIAKAKDGEHPEFAIIVFDCNDLKDINDTYGHEKGDIYLRVACQLICKVFAHSPVFRIGGDEFAVVLQDVDLQNCEVLEQRMVDGAAKINAAARNEWEHASVAWGIAKYDPAEDTDTAEVLRRADRAMYANKRKHKEALGKG